MKHVRNLFIALTGIGLSGCMGEDRSGEQPFAPTVETVSAVADGPTARMEGLITASPNSTLLDCGFRYGNDTIVFSAVAELQDRFFAETDTLKAGTYYAVAFARNGVGTNYGDTLWFEIR